jgi:hypothetical protein
MKNELNKDELIAKLAKSSVEKDEQIEELQFLSLCVKRKFNQLKSGWHKKINKLENESNKAISDSKRAFYDMQKVCDKYLKDNDKLKDEIKSLKAKLNTVELYGKGLSRRDGYVLRSDARHNILCYISDENDEKSIKDEEK